MSFSHCSLFRTLLSFLVRLSPSFDPSFVGPVRHIRQRSKSGSIFRLFRNQKSCWPKKNPAFEVVKAGSPLNLLSFSLVLLWFTRIFSLGDLVCSLRTLRDNSCVTIKFENKMFGLHRKNTKEKSPRPSASQASFKFVLNYFDECVIVQKKTNRQSFQFDVQQFCDNFVKGVDKALKNIRKSQKKSTSTRAPVAEPSFSISKKTQGEFENCFEEFKDFSDSSPIFDETDEEPIEILMSCEESCDLPYLESEFINDNEQDNVELTVLQPEHPSSLVLSQQVFEEEPLDIPHQCPCLDTWISLDEVPEPIFDVEDEPDPVFAEEATSIISTFMESHLCFDSGTTTAPSSLSPLLPDLQEHCEKSELVISLPDMFDKISSLDPDLLSFENDKTWNFLRSSCENFVDLSVDDILIYNTLFEKCLESLLVVSQSELKLVCSDVDNDMHVLKMINVVAYLDKILFCNVYFDLHFDRLKSVLLVLGNDILIFDLNKYLSCTFDPGLLVFVLSIQERQVQPLNESIGRAQQPQIWRSFVVQTGYLAASDRCSVQERYLNIPKAWNRTKIVTDEEVMNFPNQRFFSRSIREYQISKRYSCPIKKRPEPKPIIGFQMDLPASQKDKNQKKWPWDLEVMIHTPKPARPKTTLPSSFSQQTRGISKTSKFICADESVKFHDRKRVTIDVPMELECLLPSFHFYDLKETQQKRQQSVHHMKNNWS
ncbi:hypothetical protein IGI04_026479 [Brassica rapa subsp. trilocularis]|uniref:Uncharacterized protein n=1 Tax=Brassica rapa subsp. trilocularis TaxID=1813537 RepID=A0ABQ7KW69_BRACM|nr:hypothetical protein IGI04_026479 [Brassica rapa subsp. trilocularis]